MQRVGSGKHQGVALTPFQAPGSSCLDAVEERDRLEDGEAIGIDDAAIHDHLINNKVCSFQVEHDIELALR